ncbi:hypothetical protein C8Q73DRAFT_152200 [Cubamyces lactineus]|nr:hypothetical protein C8Q73DRAFT_152200 [Cubamyces lactineus]
MSTATFAEGNLVPHQSLYAIPADTPEKKRLATQYLFKRALYGWNSAIPSVIDVSQLTNVLDVAAGTCAWTFDFASLPSVSERLAETADNRLHLYACDIETQFFPEKALTDQLGITIFQQDATAPFPEHLRGMFDLVHVSFLFLCLRKEGWQKAMAHCYDALKLGGILMIDEADPVVYSRLSSVPPEDASGHDLDKALSISGWVGKANRIYAGMGLANGFITDITYRLSSLLRTAGFEIEYTTRHVAPSGPLCRAILPAHVAAEFEEFTVTNMEFILKHLAASLLAVGKLCNPDGTAVETQEAMERMVADVAEGFREEGGVSIGRCVVARKA